MKETLEQHLASLKDVPVGLVEFAKGKTAREVWEGLVRPDWLLWWAASTSVNDTFSVKLSTHDCVSVIGRPKLDPLPWWAGELWQTWESDPRRPRRVKAWEAWAAWSATLADRSTEGNLCCSMRRCRLLLPWWEEDTPAPHQALEGMRPVLAPA